MSEINWSDPRCHISEHFTVEDACRLRSWGVMHIPSLGERANIIAQAAKMELIRATIQQPIVVHCWIRPVSVNAPGSQWHGKDYNAEVGGASASKHISGLATDWHPLNITCDQAREILLSHLDGFGIRMEDKVGSHWVHTDCAALAPGGHRFFKP